MTKALENFRILGWLDGEPVGYWIGPKPGLVPAGDDCSSPADSGDQATTKPIGAETL